MAQTVQVRTFFFDAEKDYLPYYRTFDLQLDPDNSVVSVLKRIARLEERFDFDPARPYFFLNGKVVTETVRIDEASEAFGDKWEIMPLSTYRAKKCLRIDDSDFTARFALLEPYATEEDRLYYKSLYPLHYASETLRYNRDYIGDALLVTAWRMIENGSPYRDEILAAIDDPENGIRVCEYENNLFKGGEQYGEAIEALRALYPAKKRNPLAQKLQSLLPRFDKAPKRITSLEGKAIACYKGDSDIDEAKIAKAIEKIGGRYVSFAMRRKRSGRTIVEDTPKTAYKKAGAILLDAMDRGAEVLIVPNVEELRYLRTHFKAIEKAVGRDIDLALESADRLNLSFETQAA